MSKSYSPRGSGQKKPEKLKKAQPSKTSNSKRNKDVKVNNEDGVLVDTARRVETSARLIGDKTVEVVEKVADQTTEIAEVALDKLKKGVSDAFDRSSKAMSEMSKKAGRYIKKYEDTVEMKKLSHDRDLKMQELGTHIFNIYTSKPQDIEQLLMNDESQRLLNDLELLNKEIVKLGRRIKRKI